jgi:hypothetical protein
VKDKLRADATEYEEVDPYSKEKGRGRDQE